MILQSLFKFFFFCSFWRKTCLVSDVACDVKAGEEEKALVPNKDVDSRKEMLLVEPYLVSAVLIQYAQCCLSVRLLLSVSSLWREMEKLHSSSC